MKNVLEDSLLRSEARSDVVDLVRNGTVSHEFVPEQEIYFDAGVLPARSVWRVVKEEWIDGKRYIAVS